MMDVTAPSGVAPRLSSVRRALRERGMQALLVPSADPHLSEYLPARWQGRAWLSGFTGSMATLALTQDHAALFADSRYWTQAEAELAGSGIELVKIAPGGTTAAHAGWLAAHLARGDTVALDGQVLALSAAVPLRQALQRAGIALRTDLDVLDAAWTDRPGLPPDPVFEHLPPHAVHSRRDKLARVRTAMQALGATHHWLSTLDDIAWLFNLRGNDVPYNPVFLAHALVEAGQAVLFVQEGKVSAALQARLAEDGVRLAPYAQAAAALQALPQGAVVLIDPRRITLGLRECVPAGVAVVESVNPSTLMKSRKCEGEAAHLREAMAQDGAAMCEFYAWFERALRDGTGHLTELTVDERLSAARARRPGFAGLSFATIAGFNANGAMPHYRATPASHAALQGDGLLLIDSGGQYLGGTTDITRVWAVGRVTSEQRRDCTLVLKGLIALSRTRFPRGTLSPMLDAIARAPLWEHGLDYGHGTGHGVGYFLNVHEGPQTLSKAVPEPHMAMEPGMVTSIEPGLYRPGRWGVRIENLVLNVAAEADPCGGPPEHGEFLAFETLSMCPIDTRCLDVSLLRSDERAWLDAYHATVRERLGPLVDGPARQWLLERTRPLD